MLCPYGPAHLTDVIRLDDNGCWMKWYFHDMKITIRLILSFLLVSVIPLGLMGYLLLEAMDNMRSLAIDESTDCAATVRRKSD